MTLLKYGFSEADSVPTIYVVSPETVDFNTPIPKELILINVIGVTRKAIGDEQEYMEKVPNGYSIGAQGINGSGSFGGYLKNEENNAIYGFTCGHVISNSGSIVVQPSDEDWNGISDEETETKFGCYFNHGDEIYKDNGSELVWEDWSIFSVVEERQSHNHLYSIGHKQFITISSIGRLEVNDEKSIYKIGRTTGSTVGHINGVKANVKFFPDLPTTTEYTALPNGGNVLSFGATGDSGSWVINGEGKLIGFIIGTGDDRLTYISSMEFTLDRIEVKTGIKLIIPLNE